ncbi:DNA-directed RNA polymerase III subunit RPC7-like isoform X1 [Festucalex cinctus]
MLGRGRGWRGSGAGAERAAANRGEPLLLSVQQPGPLFPVMERKPLPLACGEEAEYLLALKQEFRGAMKTRPGFLQPQARHRSHADVERYLDKYLNSSEQTDALSDWITDWKRLPKEIRLCVRRTRRKAASTAVPVSASARADEHKKDGNDALVKLETLASEEQRSSDEEEEEEKKKKDDEQEADEEYDEEELEEETDYIMSYFDNGEDFGGESDDNMDEAVY